MKFGKIAVLALAALAVSAMTITTTGAAFAADKAIAKSIKSRKAQMHLYSWNLGRLGAMAKGQAAYDAKVASAAANNLLLLTKHDADGLWPKGSDSTALPGETRAKVEGWTTWPEIGEKHNDLVEAATKLSAVAGNGLDALKGAIGPVGKSCGGCHKPFRDPAKK